MHVHSTPNHRALRGFLEELMSLYAPSVISGARFEHFSFGKTPITILGVKDLTHTPTLDATQLAIGAWQGIHAPHHQSHTVWEMDVRWAGIPDVVLTLMPKTHLRVNKQRVGMRIAQCA